MRLALVALMFVLGCAHTPATGVVAGTVTDDSGIPQEYCFVIIRDAANGKAFGAQTGRDGKYSVPRVPAGIHMVHSSGAGLAREDRDSVQVSERDTTIVNFRLKRIEPILRK